jgi:DNA polymerase III alpha subunit (gram-positive type)
LIIFDCEADNLLREATKTHIFGWTTDGKVVKTSTTPEEFFEALDKEEYAGCHNSFCYDFPLFEKLHGYTYKGIKVDTLYLSWYLYPRRVKHGLAAWGNDLGVQKVKVEDEQWKEGDLELMTLRVTEDVKINWKLWEVQKRDLERLYT